MTIETQQMRCALPVPEPAVSCESVRWTVTRSHKENSLWCQIRAWHMAGVVTPLQPGPLAGQEARPGLQSVSQSVRDLECTVRSVCRVGTVLPSQVMGT